MPAGPRTDLKVCPYGAKVDVVGAALKVGPVPSRRRDAEDDA